MDLLLAGDGQLRAALERQAAELGITPRVHFLGVRGDVPNLLRAADVFALTSVSEAASITVLEAMASGVPSVVTGVGGNPEIVGKDATASWCLAAIIEAAADSAPAVAATIRTLDAQLGASARTAGSRDLSAESHHRALPRALRRGAPAGHGPRVSSRETRLTVVIPVRDDARRLDACLQSLLAQPGGVDVPVIVADNGSKDDTPDVARRHGATVLTLPGLSVAQMRNRAVARTTTPLVGLVDADHVLAPGWLEASLDALADPSVAAAGAPYRCADAGNWVQRAYDRFRDRPHAPRRHRLARQRQPGHSPRRLQQPGRIR